MQRGPNHAKAISRASTVLHILSLLLSCIRYYTGYAIQATTQVQIMEREAEAAAFLMLVVGCDTAPSKWYLRLQLHQERKSQIGSDLPQQFI
jgi:hypothetical protein